VTTVEDIQREHIGTLQRIIDVQRQSIERLEQNVAQLTDRMNERTMEAARAIAQRPQDTEALTAIRELHQILELIHPQGGVNIQMPGTIAQGMVEGFGLLLPRLADAQAARGHPRAVNAVVDAAARGPPAGLIPVPPPAPPAVPAVAPGEGAGGPPGEPADAPPAPADDAEPPAEAPPAVP